MTEYSKVERISEQLDVDLSLSTADPKQLIHFYDHLIMVFGDDSISAKNWLHSPSAQVDQNKASELLMSEQGVSSVIAVLRKILEQDSRIG